MKNIAILLFLMVATACERTPKKNEKVRFLREPVTKRLSMTEFTDAKKIKIECFQVEYDGTTKLLWMEQLVPYDDGLGNTLMIDYRETLTISGKGAKLFLQEMKGVDVEDIQQHYQGRSASLDPACVIWSAFVSDKEQDLGVYPRLPNGLEDVVASCKSAKSEGLVIIATKQ